MFTCGALVAVNTMSVMADTVCEKTNALSPTALAMGSLPLTLSSVTLPIAGVASLT